MRGQWETKMKKIVEEIQEKLKNGGSITETLSAMGFIDATNHPHQLYVKVDDEGFPIAYYDSRVHSDRHITEDCIPITDEQHKHIHNNPDKKFKVKKIEDNVELEEVPHSPEFLAEREQFHINLQNEQFLKATDWIVTKHRDQKEAGIKTTLTDKDYQELLSKRQAARDAIIKD